MLLEEYLSTYDVAEAGECLKELQAPQQHYKAVEKALTIAIDRKEEVRTLMSKLLCELHSEFNVLSQEAIAKGFDEVLSVIEDTDLDMPKASTNLGQMIGKAVLDEILPLSYLNAGLDHVIASGKALKIASEAFHTIANGTSTEEMASLYKQSGMDFMRFLKEENRNVKFLGQFLRDQRIPDEAGLPALLGAQ